MNHIQTILQSAVSRIVEGSTVAGIAEISANNYTFTTTDLKNIRVGLSVLIGGIRFKVTAINTKTKTVSIYGFSLPAGSTWQLSLYLRYGSRVEVNALLSADSAVNKEIFPFIWLILNYPQTPAPNIGLNAYSTEIKVLFVNSSEDKIIASERLTQNFEPVFDNITDLFFAELNTLPTAANFARKTSEPISGKMIDRYFFGSQEANSNVFSVNQTDAREYDIALKVYDSACLGSNSNFLPVLVPSFSYVDNSDSEAFTDELFTARIALTNTTNDLRPVEYAVTFDWGVLGNEVHVGTLNFGQSVNLVSAKVLTGITGAYTINISGSVVSSIVLDAQLRTPIFTYENESNVQLYTFALGLSADFTAKFDDNNTPFVIQDIIDIEKYSNVIGDVSLISTDLQTKILGIYLQLGVKTKFVDCSRMTNLETVRVQNNIITEILMPITAYVIDFQAQNNLLSESEINNILTKLVDYGTTDGYCDLTGIGNSAPTGQGIIDKATLQSRGWTVLTN